MRRHSLRWRCASKSHSGMFFDTRDDYVSHMKANHRKALTDEQIFVLADRSLQLTGPLFKSCLFCGAEEQDSKGRLEEHIVGHLRSLALKSLPPNDDEGRETPNLEKSEETDHERSTVKNDPGRNTILDFGLDSLNYDDVSEAYTDYIIPGETDDDFWDFIPTKSATTLDEDLIIEHLIRHQKAVTAEEPLREDILPVSHRRYGQRELEFSQGG